jgi:hypothetical protein
MQQQAPEPEQVPEETIQLLNQYQERFTRTVTNNLNRVERIEKLMKRSSAEKWSIDKMTKMIRRQQAAQKAIDDSSQMLEQVNFRLQQYTPSV